MLEKENIAQANGNCFHLSNVTDELLMYFLHKSMFFKYIGLMT